MNESNLDGVIVVDKPIDWTSHDVVAKMRGIAGTRRVGHLGTLDPIATGVLPVMIGNVTRLAQFWDKAEKTYDATIRFGYATTTYDRAGERVGEKIVPTLSADAIEALLAPMRGEIEQVPPPVSAKKIGGVPAYKLVRQNIPVELKAVRVTLKELVLTGVEGPLIQLHVRCTSGTYIRAIAHDLGRQLGCGAHIEELVRTESGPFRIGQARTLEQLQLLKAEGCLAEALVSAEELLPAFPSVFIDDLTRRHIRQGRDFNASPFRIQPGTEYVKAIGPDGRLVAVGKIVLAHVYHPIVVI